MHYTFLILSLIFLIGCESKSDTGKTTSSDQKVIAQNIIASSKRWLTDFNTTDFELLRENLPPGVSEDQVVLLLGGPHDSTQDDGHGFYEYIAKDHVTDKSANWSAEFDQNDILIEWVNNGTYTILEGDALLSFLGNYVEVEVNEINKGYSISLRVPNAEESDRNFYSIQFFLVSPDPDSEEVDTDVFEVTSGQNGRDINYLMNISEAKLQVSYVVLREQRKDNPKQEAEWVETTIRLPDLVTATQSREGEQVGAGQPATAPELKSEGKDKPKTEAEVRPR